MIRAALKLATGSVIGKLSGVLREILLATAFGTGAVASAARASQTATLVPVEFFAANALSAGFLPLYSSIEKEGRERVIGLFWAVLSIMVPISFGILLMLLVLAESWVSVVAPGFGPEARGLTIELLKVSALGVPFYVAGNLLSYLAMANGEFSLASMRATIQNVGMILGIALAWCFSDFSLIAWAFLCSYALYSALGVRAACVGSWAPVSMLRREYYFDSMFRFLRAIRPLLLLPVVLQAGVVAERAIASLISDSTVAALGYAKLITETGVLLLAMPLGLAGLATMGSMTAVEFRSVLVKVVSALLIVTVPISFILLLHGETLVRLLFQHGEFGENSTASTVSILSSMSVGLWAQVVSYFLVKAMSARMRNGMVVAFTMISVAVQILISFLLYKKIGGVALGCAAAAASVLLTFMCCWNLGVLGDFSKWLFPMLIIGGGHVAAVMTLPLPGVGELGVAGVFCGYWALALLLWRRSRTVAFGLIRRSLGKIYDK